MDDLLDELGALALGSRLKRLSDSLMQDGVKIYQSLEAGFEPRWFPVFIYLHRKGPTAITELARGLGVSHPGINKIANELIAAKLVAPYRDRNDKRKRVLALTRTGREKVEALEPGWRDIRRALQSALEEGGGEFLANLAALESSFKQQSFAARFDEQHAREDAAVSLQAFRPDYAGDFKTLNTTWIEQHFARLEAADERLLGNPEHEIIGQGGSILFAVVNEKALGTCALIRLDDQTAELAKMAVDPAARGMRLGYLLGQGIVTLARDQGFARLCLESNRILTPAISLYEKLGFKEAPFPHPSDYNRADIYMEMDLQTS